MAVQINSGYITFQSIGIIFNLIGDIDKKLFDLNVLKFGIGNKSNYVIPVAPLPDLEARTNLYGISDRTFEYATKTFTLSSVEMADLPVSLINLGIYKYILIKKTSFEYATPVYWVYEVDSITTRTITIKESSIATELGTTGITILGFVQSNTGNDGKLVEFEKTYRTVPLIGNVEPSGILGNVQSIEKFDDTTVEVVCQINENPLLTTPIYFDEVYLYGRNSNQTDANLKLAFVAETIYGSGVYTGAESNIFNIRISISNLTQVESITYNIDNLAVKNDVEVLQLMFLYILSLKNMNTRKLNAKLDAIDAFIADFKDVNFTTKLVEKMRDYVYGRFNQKYSTSTDNLFTLDIKLMDAINLPNFKVSSISDATVKEDIKRIIGVVPKAITVSGTTYVGGYEQTTLFYVSNGTAGVFGNNKIGAINLDITINTANLTAMDSLLKSIYKNIIFTDYMVFNVNLLSDVLTSGYTEKTA